MFDGLVSRVLPGPRFLTPSEGSLSIADLKFAPSAFPQESERLWRAWNCPNGRVPVEFHFEDDGIGGPEAYRLQVDSAGVSVRSKGAAGAFYATQTLRQISEAGRLPFVDILDAPRYSWRGFMLDVSRHMFSTAHILDLLEVMAELKLNVFHWHLTDDGGWRLNSSSYPRLTTHGAFREYRKEGWDYFDIKFVGDTEEGYGGFYDQADIRAIVKRAGELHITIVPEIDLPGHCLAACVSYPELVCTEEAVAAFHRETKMSGPNVMCCGSPAVLPFVETILSEIVDFFPGPFVHIGGDEVETILWSHCERCQELKGRLGLTRDLELQGHFVHQVSEILEKLGRKLIGWDEILEVPISDSATIMSWRGTSGGIAAANKGHNVIMTPTRHCYFDYSYQLLPSAKVAAFDPCESVPADRRDFILGGQANLWTEYVPTWEEVQRRIFPRLAAMSESLWSGPQTKEQWAAKEGPYLARLEAKGIPYEGSQRLSAVATFQSGPVYLND